MDTFLATFSAWLVGVILLALAVAGVSNNVPVALSVGGVLVLAPTIALLGGSRSTR